jgi:hypothetical protein
MSAAGLTWPDAHVHWQGVIPADPDFGVPFGVHVFIFHTTEQLRAASGHDTAVAHSVTFDHVDDAGVGALLFFTLEELHLSLAAHEATHVALAHHGNEERSRIGAKRWLWDHPESVAEMIGNLTVLVWRHLYENGIGDE